jgi:RAD51-like protein 2
MAMQLALDVQIPAVFRGCGGEAVYIDTEGSCLPSRLATMAESVAKHLQQIAKSSASRQSQLSQMSQLTTLTQEQAADLQHKQNIADRKVSEAANVSVESLLNGVHMFRTHDQIELLAVIAQLSLFLESHPKVS